jgi:DNA polymerase I-like protein with 3'-5' exonuclease and polymerase domains
VFLTVCRDAFVAPEGRVLLSADYAQMELRLMAHLSADEALCAVLRDPSQDPFSLWASEWLRMPLAQVFARLTSRDVKARITPHI